MTYTIGAMSLPVGSGIGEELCKESLIRGTPDYRWPVLSSA